MTQKVTQKRSPVIVILGHVDHGKTTLLDYIRKTNVAAREAGGITQSIGAYEIEHSGKRLTFIDTPGHEAFSKMRSRGIKVADLAILVVAVDDGVQPQTKEAIKIIQEAKIPFVVAINKVDKEGVDINKVKNELTAEGVLLEGYGGNVSSTAISAKTGKGVSELLDLLALAADLEDLFFNPKSPGKGFIIEARLDGRQGITATGIMKDGVLKVGDPIVAGSAFGKVKGLENFLGKRVKEVLPSSPVVISGFESLPEVGVEFLAAEAGSLINANVKKPSRIFANKISDDSRAISLILKADVSGSLEALSQIIKNLPKPEKVEMKIIDESVGDISDGDVQSAVATGAIIVGFKVRTSKAALNLAESQRVKIITSEIVYDLVKTLEGEFKKFEKYVARGDLEILAVFGKKDSSQIVGGRVVAGAILNNAVLEVSRRDVFLGKAKIINLQKERKDVQKVETGNECGLLVDSEVIIKVGDHLILR
ncbi:MAG TPA: translation initiation factor IF-2 [Candidatus Paceibacterota bacterium]